MKKLLILLLFCSKAFGQCLPPTNLAVTNLSSTGGRLGYTAPTGATLYSWNIYTVYPSHVLATQGTGTATTFTFGGLQPSTQYRIQIVSICGQTVSASDSVVFTTPASTITYTPMDNAGYRYKQLQVDGGLALPLVDTVIGNGVNRAGRIVYKPTKGAYSFNGFSWDKVAKEVIAISRDHSVSITPNTPLEDTIDFSAQTAGSASLQSYIIDFGPDPELTDNVVNFLPNIVYVTPLGRDTISTSTSYTVAYANPGEKRVVLVVVDPVTNLLDTLEGIPDSFNAVKRSVPDGKIEFANINIYGTDSVRVNFVATYQRKALVFIDAAGNLTTDSTHFFVDRVNNIIYSGSFYATSVGKVALAFPGGSDIRAIGENGRIYLTGAASSVASEITQRVGLTSEKTAVLRASGNYYIGQATNTDIPAARLAIVDSTKGFLMPKGTTANMNAIASPIDGLMFYNTTDTVPYYYKRGIGWVPLKSTGGGGGTTITGIDDVLALGNTAVDKDIILTTTTIDGNEIEVSPNNSTTFGGGFKATCCVPPKTTDYGALGIYDQSGNIIQWPDGVSGQHVTYPFKWVLNGVDYTANTVTGEVDLGTAGSAFTDTLTGGAITHTGALFNNGAATFDGGGTTDFKVLNHEEIEMAATEYASLVAAEYVQLIGGGAEYDSAAAYLKLKPDSASLWSGWSYLSSELTLKQNDFWLSTDRTHTEFRGSYIHGFGSHSYQWSGNTDLGAYLEMDDGYLDLSNGHGNLSANPGNNGGSDCLNVTFPETRFGNKVSVGSRDSAIIEPSAVLGAYSTSQGFLPPRMNGEQAEAIASPAEGLMVYIRNGDGIIITSPGWWGYDGTTWVKLH